MCLGGNKKKFKRGSYRGRGGRGRGFNSHDGSYGQYHNENHAANGQTYNRATTTQVEVDTGYDSTHNPHGRWQSRGRGNHRGQRGRGGGFNGRERSNDQYPNENHAAYGQSYYRTTTSQEKLDTGYDSTHNQGPGGHGHNRGRGNHRGQRGRGGGFNGRERSNDQYPNENYAANGQNFIRTTTSEEELDTGYDYTHNHGFRGRGHNRGRRSHRRNFSNARGGRSSQYEAAENNNNNEQPIPFKCNLPFISSFLL